MSLPTQQAARAVRMASIREPRAQVQRARFSFTGSEGPRRVACGRAASGPLEL